MKTPFKVMVAVSALLMSNLALASATLKDVETAVKVTKDYRQAEHLMQEVLTSDPDNAKDHWIYSEILRKNGKHNDAVHELEEAKRLDPALTFVRNPAVVATYEASLNAESANRPVYAPPPRTEQRYTPAAAALPQPTAEHNAGHSLLWVVLILGVLGVAVYFLFRRLQEHDRVEDEARLNAARQDQLKQASALLESVKPLKLDIRMANPANPALLAEVEDAEREIVGLVERLEKQPIAQNEIEAQEENLAHLRRKFEGKPDPLVPVQAEYGTTQNGDAHYGDPNGVGRQPVSPVYQQQVPQTVYVQNNPAGGMGGLLTGLALGSLMGGGHDREVIREIREVPVRRGDNGDAGSGQSDIDFGSDNYSENDNGDNGGGGGIDFGGSDDN